MTKAMWIEKFGEEAYQLFLKEKRAYYKQKKAEEAEAKIPDSVLAKNHAYIVALAKKKRIDSMKCGSLL